MRVQRKGGGEGAREHCGVMGVYGSDRAAELVYLGLYALQHRGQESAGIAVSDGGILRSARGAGLLPAAV